MTINDMYTKLESQLTQLNSGSSLHVRLAAIVYRLDELRVNHGSKKVRSDIQNLVKRFSLYKGEESLRKINDYLDEVDIAIERSIEGIKKDEETAGSSTTAKTDRGFWNSRFADFLPLIVSVVVLVIGLSLGLTVFNGNQDGWYFALEFIKDLMGCVISGTAVKQVINRERKTQNGIGIVMVAFGVGIIALIFSVILFLAMQLSVIERFTDWGKLSYLWMVITLCIISVVCMLSIIFYLVKYYRNSTKEVDKQ